MAQFLRPDGDITTTNVSAGGFGSIDEASRSDADFVIGTNNTTTIFECSLSNVATPEAGTCTVRFAHAQGDHDTSPFAPASEGQGFTTVTCELVEGTTVLATDAAQTNSAAWVQREFTFNTSLVTDWTDLRLRFTISGSGGSVANRRTGAVSWAEIETPNAAPVVNTQTVTSAIVVADPQVAEKRLTRLATEPLTIDDTGAGLGIARRRTYHTFDWVEDADAVDAVYVPAEETGTVHTETATSAIALDDTALPETVRNRLHESLTDVADAALADVVALRTATVSSELTTDDARCVERTTQRASELQVDDAALLALLVTRQPESAIGLTDASASELLLQRVHEDTVGVDDERAVIHSRSREDALDVTDEKQQSVIGEGIVNTVVASSLLETGDESFTQRWAERASALDLADATLSETVFNRTTDDAVTLDDASEHAAERAALVTSELTSADAAAAELLLTRVAEDALDATDSLIAQASQSVVHERVATSALDTADATDAALTLDRVATDPVAAADEAAPELLRTRLTDDSIELTDAVGESSRVAQPIATDALVTVDESSQFSNRTRSITDLITAPIDETQSIAERVRLADSLLVAEDEAIAAAVVGGVSIIVAEDAIALDDASSSVRTVARDDVLDLTDAFEVPSAAAPLETIGGRRRRRVRAPLRIAIVEQPDVLQIRCETSWAEDDEEFFMMAGVA